MSQLFYLLMDGNFPSLNHSRYADRSEAETEAKRLNEIRTKKNELAKNFVYKERGDAFRAPRYIDWTYWVKEISIEEIDDE